MIPDQSLRKHLTDNLQAGHAHVGFEQVLADWDAESRGAKPPGANHTAWQLLEHLRIAQWDILEFSKSADHVSPEWPDRYWPDSEGPSDDQAWEESIRLFEKDLKAMQSLVTDPTTDLYASIPHGDGQTILREALTLAAHNSYHVGQLMTLRKILGA